jgi:beta-lactamase superfamily II metal-dependent hydrolase
MWNWLRLFVFFTAAALSGSSIAQSTSRLQIHYMDVWQGDGAVLISPGGKVVLFDDGVKGHCDRPLAYLEALGITQIDYHVASHYHQDHIGCAGEVLGQYPLSTTAYDRGSTYPGDPFKAYRTAVGSKRKTANVGDKFVLDEGTAHPVTVTFVALGGNAVPTDNENDLSLVAVVEFDGFRTEFGGDLSGEKTSNYEDIETSVAALVGPIDVYKVHHHCSSYSTNEHWLETTKPTVAIISTGNGNTYGHPAEDCLARLHDTSIKRIYWTETGKGKDPEPPIDVIAGNVVVKVDQGTGQFTVSFNGGQEVDQYTTQAAAGATPPTPPGTPKFTWSKNSGIFHHSECSVAKRISASNRETGDTEPPGRQLHNGCPYVRE